MSNFTKHLDSRGFNPWLYATNCVAVDYEAELATFCLYNTDGVMVGTQVYDWNKSKKLKYKTTSSSYGMWGLDFLDLEGQDTLFVVEGVWDAMTLHDLGLNAVAVLCNTPPKEVVEKLKKLAPKVVALCDGDSAGMKLGRKFDSMLVMPEGQDPNSMGSEALASFLSENGLLNR